MAYPGFHQLHPELAHVGVWGEPVFLDTEISPVHEDSYHGLLSHIVAANDVAAFHLYHANPHKPGVLGRLHESTLASFLGLLLGIDLSDPVYQMPKYPPLQE